MKDVTVRTSIAAEDTKDGKEFTGGRTFPFPEKIEERAAWEQLYAKVAAEKKWETMPDFLADAETGFRIRVGKEIREKAKTAYGKPVEKAAAGAKSDEPLGTVL